MANESIPGVVAAIKELPGWTGTDEEAIHRATQLIWKSRLLQINRINRATHTRQQNGRAKEIDRIARAAVELANSINGAHGDTLEVLSRFTEKDPLATGINVEHLLEGCVKALDAEPAQAAIEGRRPDPYPPALTDLLAEEFHEITGKPPALINSNPTSKRGQQTEGAFVDFVAKAFSDLDCGASAPSQARAAAKRFREGIPNEREVGMLVIRKGSKSTP